VSVHLNRPGKKHSSGFGLPPIAVTEINKKSREFAYKGKIITGLMTLTIHD